MCCWRRRRRLYGDFGSGGQGVEIAAVGGYVMLDPRRPRSPSALIDSYEDRVMLVRVTSQTDCMSQRDDERW